jgi:alpha-galactosidase
MWSKVTNVSESSVELEHLTRFVLSGLTSFAADDASGRMRLHRFRSWWSHEGRHENELFEDIHLVRNWQGNIMSNERFGQVGT